MMAHEKKRRKKKEKKEHLSIRPCVWLQLLEDLEQDNQANAQQMSAKLGHVVTAMEGPSARMAYV